MFVGLENHDSGIGIYAPDAESYSVFSDLFDPIIEDYHGGFKKTDKHPPKNWGDVNTFGDLDPTGEYIVSTRVRCGRSLEGYPFNPCLTEEQYKEMEQKVSSTLSGLDGEFSQQFRYIDDAVSVFASEILYCIQCFHSIWNLTNPHHYLR